MSAGAAGVLGVLAVVGRDRSTPVGRALGLWAGLREIEPDGLAGLLRPATAPAVTAEGAGAIVIVGAACPDPLGAAREAAGAGATVVLEVLGDEPDRLEELAAGDLPGSVIPALRRRHEPDVGWATTAVAGGSIGLPWGAQAEILASYAPDAVGEAVDVVDALERVAGTRLEEAVHLDRASAGRRPRSSGIPLLASLAFENGVVGRVVVRPAPRRPAPRSGRAAGRDLELATLRVTGSHGTVLVELDAPWLSVLDGNGERRERSSRSGAELMLEAVGRQARGEGSAALASLADAARLLRLLGPRGRRGRRGGGRGW